jgi:hypothetical protein
MIGGTREHGRSGPMDHRIHVHDHAADLIVPRQLVHHIEEDFFQDGAEPTGTGSTFKRLGGDRR